MNIELRPTDKEALSTITRRAREAGATEIQIEFDGCGDSGSIETIWFDKSTVMPDFEVPYVRHRSVYLSGRWTEDTEHTHVHWRKALTAISYAILDASNIDWYNNEGGYGEITIHLDGPLDVIELNMNQRIETVEHHYFEVT